MVVRVAEGLSGEGGQGASNWSKGLRRGRREGVREGGGKE